MKYPRNEIWERKSYKSLMESGELKTLFRPGDRICDNDSKKKCFYLGEVLTLRVLDIPGNEKMEVPPNFVSGFEKKVKIVNMEVISIENLKEEDFKSSYSYINSGGKLRYYLSLIYNEDPFLFDKVTKIGIEYLDVEKSEENLN
jgi:hypothetical protein